MKYLLRIIIFMCVAMVAACGMQGDLYLPEDGSSQNSLNQSKSS